MAGFAGGRAPSPPASLYRLDAERAHSASLSYSANPIYLVVPPFNRKRLTMLDLILPALGFGLFALSIGYAYVCDRL